MNDSLIYTLIIFSSILFLSAADDKWHAIHKLEDTAGSLIKDLNNAKTFSEEQSSQLQELSNRISELDNFYKQLQLNLTEAKHSYLNMDFLINFQDYMLNNDIYHIIVPVMFTVLICGVSFYCFTNYFLNNNPPIIRAEAIHPVQAVEPIANIQQQQQDQIVNFIAEYGANRLLEDQNFLDNFILDLIQQNEVDLAQIPAPVIEAVANMM